MGARGMDDDLPLLGQQLLDDDDDLQEGPKHRDLPVCPEPDYEPEQLYAYCKGRMRLRPIVRSGDPLCRGR